MMNRTVFLCLVLFSLFIHSTYSKESLLVVRQDGKDFQDALKGITDELQNEFSIIDMVVNKKTDGEELIKTIKEKSPKVAILMDNVSIALFKKYQNTIPENQKPIPSVALMGVLVKDAIQGLKNATGISYEVPIVTSIVSLRSVLKVPMKKVGVIRREFLDDFLQQNKDFCEKEGIGIIDVSLPNKSKDYKSLLKKSLKTIVEENGAQALWVPNDNAFLQPDIIQSIWVPLVKKYKIPVIVGVEILVKPQLGFGTFAVLPDHVSLGSQAAEIVYEIMDNEWDVDGRDVEPPLAVYKIINYPQINKNYKVTEESLKSVDKIIK